MSVLSQSERVKHRLIEMQTAATVGFPDPQLKAGAITQFQTETRLLSHAAAAAMASLVVRIIVYKIYLLLNAQTLI